MLLACSPQHDLSREGQGNVLTILAIGDAGLRGSDLRANASLMTNMFTGQHDGGQFDALIFLGDNFYDIGLNVPANEVEGKVNSILDLFRVPIASLGRGKIHVVAGNHDYYARHALETSVLFGLIDIEEGPVGLSDKGNERERAIDRWSYYYDMPAQAFYRIEGESGDTLQLVFFDSARLLRTKPARWRGALDSLETLLRVAAHRPGIIWRALCLHHPFVSLGEHAGYTVWNDETNTVEYLTPCDKDTNAVAWFKNLLDPEDLCADQYGRYIDSVRAVIGRSGAKIHILLSGHDHSLQLLYYPEQTVVCAECPRVTIISGAGSKVSRVREARPPREFTASQQTREREGISRSGFAQLMFTKDRVRVVFFEGRTGESIDMGGGRKEFWIDRNGDLVGSEHKPL